MKINSMLVDRVAFLSFTFTPLELLNNLPTSIMIPIIYGLIKRLNTEINQCLLKNFPKPGVLTFSAA